MTDLLITGGTVITVDRERRVIEAGAVALTGDRISYVGAAADGPRPDNARRVIDAAGGIVLPGLIDAHGHAGHGLLKTIASDTPSFWGKVVTNVYYHFTDPEYWYAEGRLSALERLMFGVTTGLCVVASEPRGDDPELSIAHARAYGEAGLREVVAVGPCNPPFPRPASRWTSGARVPADFSFEDAMAGTEAVIRACHGAAGGRIGVMVTPFLIVPSCDSSGPTPTDKAAALTDHDRLQSRRVRELTREHGLRIHSDAFGGMVRLAAGDPNGLLGPDVHVQHATGLGSDEIRILADTGTAVGHAPLSGSLIKARCPVVELLEAGATVAITTDGTAPRTTFDLLAGARFAARLQQIHFQDGALLPAGKLLEMITIDAARALGLEREIGSLEVGKKADVIVLGTDRPHLTPMLMPVHRVVYEATGNDVETVIVDGLVLMENREPQRVAKSDILAAAEAVSRRTIERAGLAPFIAPPDSFWSNARARIGDDRADRIPS